MDGEGKPLKQGLTAEQASRLLQQFGYNEVAEEVSRPWLAFLGKFWAPVPWMLEATIALQIYSGKTGEAAIISILLVFNAILSFAHERRANNALQLLKRRLDIQARVLRDGAWKRVPARELVPGDVVYLRLGDLAPADIRLYDGNLLLDESSLTGESLPVEAAAGGTAYAGVIIRRGEAAGEVTATGARTYFGKTAELVRTARTKSHLERLIFTIVKYLVALDLVLVVALLLYSLSVGLPMTEVVPFALILLVASVPIALPATYTLATALGALELAKNGVLVTRLSAIEEAASMDVLASDKTGTITQNRLALAMLMPYAGFDEADVLRLAALASDEATQDPIDVAILEAARLQGLAQPGLHRLRFVPFDPESKRSEALYDHGQHTLRVVKGAPRQLAALCQGQPEIGDDVERLGAQGARVLAVATEDAGGGLQLAGLLALQDPARADSAALVHDLHQLGVRVMMVSGDGPATARAIAGQVGIGERVCPPGPLGQRSSSEVLGYDVFARVLPEDKYNLVRSLQGAGHIVGMSGDGVNDAPALKQAEVGIAVASATDVAKAAASLVLTNPGLTDIRAAVQTSRRVYTRMLTYTLNKIIKTFEIAIFLTAGVMLTGVFVITPLLMVLLLFTNDFVTMSIATDNAEYAPVPERWNVPRLMLIAGTLAAFVLALSFTVFYAGRVYLHLPVAQLQTLIFLMLVLTGQGNVYLVRERRHFWRSIPGRWLLFASIVDIAVVSLIAWRGILMAPIPPALIAALLLVVVAYLFALDFIKVRVFNYVDR